MTLYRVLKDFPSRNGATQYRTGENVTLDDNTRTKALVEMGYITNRESAILNRIAFVIQKVTNARRVEVKQYGTKNKTKLLDVEVEE